MESGVEEAGSAGGEAPALRFCTPLRASPEDIDESDGMEMKILDDVGS
jgi:hypothetical protein